MRVVITGAFGFLGGRLAEGLRAAGAEVVLSGRRVPKSAEAWARGFEVRLGDLLDADVPARLVRGVDAVIHLASLDENEAVQAPDLALAVSGEATRRLAAAARAAGASRFVFFSTFHVYGPTAPHVIDEETPTKAAHPYSIAHLAGEGYCRQAYLAGFPAVVLRVSNGYGCPTRVDVERWTLAHNDFCLQAVKVGRITLKTPGLQQRDFVAVTDIVQAVQRVLAAPREALGEGVFNVGGEHSISVLALAQLVQARAQRMLGVDVPIERPVGGSHPPAPPPIELSVARMRKLGYAPAGSLEVETDRLFALLSREAPPTADAALPASGTPAAPPPMPRARADA